MRMVSLLQKHKLSQSMTYPPSHAGSEYLDPEFFYKSKMKMGRPLGPEGPKTTLERPDFHLEDQEQKVGASQPAFRVWNHSIHSVCVLPGQPKAPPSHLSGSLGSSSTRQVSAAASRGTTSIPQESGSQIWKGQVGLKPTRLHLAG
jgi:hypothetical protein